MLSPALTNGNLDVEKNVVAATKRPQNGLKRGIKTASKRPQNGLKTASKRPQKMASLTSTSLGNRVTR
jgi:hypothetical protein